MKKKSLFIIIISSFIFIFMIFLENQGVFKKSPDDPHYINKQINEIQNAWNFKINDNYELTYHKISDLSFRGDGFKYFVLTLNNKNQLNDINLNTTKNKTFEKELNEAINVENYNLQKIPNFDRQYNWEKFNQKNDSLFILYFPDTLELYIIESRI